MALVALKIRKQTFHALLTLPICLFLAAINFFRTPDWSYDIIEYQPAFDLINKTSFSSLNDFINLSFEPAFVFSSVVAGYFTQSVNVVLFSFSLISLLIKLVYIPVIYVKKPILLAATYALTYYILLELTQNRIAIASAILLAGYHFLNTNRRILFVTSVLIASLFHYTAILGLLALYFNNQSGSTAIKRHLILFLILLSASYLFKTTFIFSLIELLDAKKASYLSSADDDLGTGFIRVAFVVFFQILILIACRPSTIKSINPSITRFHELLFHLYIASISIYLALHYFGVVAVRLAEVFRNLEPLLLILTISTCFNEKKLLVSLVILISIFVNLHKNNHIIYPINQIFLNLNLTDKHF